MLWKQISTCKVVKCHGYFERYSRLIPSCNYHQTSVCLALLDSDSVLYISNIGGKWEYGNTFDKEIAELKMHASALS